jgi:hypothetical protein
MICFAAYPAVTEGNLPAAEAATAEDTKESAATPDNAPTTAPDITGWVNATFQVGLSCESIIAPVPTSIS